MKKVLVSGYIGFDNFGDEAIFFALLKHLRTLGCNVCALSSNPLKTEKQYKVFTYYYKSLKDILRGILSCDILISGGGSLLQNKTSSFSLVYYLFVIILSKIFNKKVMIFSQGIEKIKGDFFEKLTMFVLKKVDFISVRDKNSFEYLKTFDIFSVLTSDPVYSLCQSIKQNEEKKGIIVQLREFKGLEDKITDDLVKILSDTKENIKILSLHDKFDKRPCLKLQEKLSLRGVNAEVICNKSIDEVIEIINGAKYMFSMRFHGALSAYALGCKTFALCYDDKIKNLSNESGLQNIDLFDYTFDELNKKTDIFFNTQYRVKPYRKYDWSAFDDWIKNN